MSHHYNDFCLYCCGNKKKDVRECRDISCPFYPFKYGGLEPEVEQDICKKIVKNVLTIDKE